MRVALVNGAPRTGKDTAAAALAAAIPGSAVMPLSRHLKTATHAAYGIDAPHDAFEATKDDYSADFLGLTPRSAYIYHSESYMKPLHGNTVFGRLYAREIVASGHQVVINPSTGFAAECKPIIDAVGLENVLLFRLSRPGRDFSSDSRSLIMLPGVETYHVDNTGSQADFETDVVGIVRGWLS